MNSIKHEVMKTKSLVWVLIVLAFIGCSSAIDEIAYEPPEYIYESAGSWVCDYGNEGLSLLDHYTIMFVDNEFLC